MEKCQNCNKEIEQAKFATHFGYCRRNVIKCTECSEYYDKNFKEEHQQQFHSTQKCQYCQNKFKKNEISNHKNKCSMKPIFCQYCQLNVPCQDFNKHTKICQSRTSLCEKCNSSIINKNYSVHVATCTGKKRIIEQNNRPQRKQLPCYQMQDSLSRLSREVEIQKPSFKKDKMKLEKKEQNYVQSKLKQQIKAQISKKREIPYRQKVQPKKQITKSEIRNPEELSRHHFNQNFFSPMDYEDLNEINSYETYDPFSFNNDLIQQSLFREQMKSKMKPSINNEFGDLSQQDQLLQQTLFNSNKKMRASNGFPKQVPKDFMSTEIMNSSFYGDILDIQKQKAIQRQFASKERKNTSNRSRKN